MKSGQTSLSHPLARVRGLGSAKDGTNHWWSMRLTSLALIPLSLWWIGSLMAAVVGYGWPGAVSFISHPVNTALMLLFIGFSCHHSAAGIQTVLEDYISHHGARVALLILNNAVHLLLALAGSLATLKIFFAFSI